MDCQHEWKYDNMLGDDFCRLCRTLKAFKSTEVQVAEAVAAERERCASIVESCQGCSCGAEYCYEVECYVTHAAKRIRNEG